MTHSRRDTIKLGLLGSICAGAGEFPANAFAQAAVESIQTIAQPLHWARGVEGQRKPDLGNGYYLNPIISGDASRGIPGRLQAPPNPVSKTALRMVNDNHTVSFATKFDGGSWIRYPQHIEVSGYHKNVVRDGESLRIGLYAIGSGKARFKNFTYQGQV